MECSELLVTMSFCSRASRLKLLRCLVRDAADIAGLDDEGVDAVVLAVNEACMNVIQHAYAMQPDGIIELAIYHDEKALIIQLRDFAAPVDPGKVAARDLEDVRPGGLGVYLIESLMDECTFMQPPEGGGNLLEMKKYIHQAQGSKQ